MSGYIVVCCITILTIVSISSGEPCAHGVRLIQNHTGVYIEWSRLGRNCGDVWIRSTKDTRLESSPMRIQLGGTPIVICRNTNCEHVTGIDIDQDDGGSTRTTTSSPLMTTSSRNGPNSNTVALSDAQSSTERGPVDEFPTLLVTVSVVCSVVVLIMVVILVVCIVKGRRTHPVKRAVPVVNNTRSLRREDIEHRVNVDAPDNEVGSYAAAGDISHAPSDVYAVVAKRQDRAATVGDMYAVVQKPTTAVQPGRAADLAADPGSMYAEVQKPSNAAQKLMLQEENHRPNQDVSRNKTTEGLMYLDVDFSDAPDQSGRPLLQYPQGDSEYANVQHT